MFRIYILLYFFCNVALGQSTIDSVYFKHKYITTKKLKRAKYILVTEKINDSLTKKFFSEKNTNRKIWTETYLNGQPYGFWEKFDEQGNISSKLNYNFKVEYGLNVDRDKELLSNDNILEISPSIENEKTISSHMRKTYQYPDSAIIEMIKGTVVFMITVNTKGETGNVRILKAVNPIIDAEAYRIANSIPDLKPETKNGSKIYALYKLYVSFKIQ